MSEQQPAPFPIGSRVIKNPATWRPSEFDRWGAGEGVGVVVECSWYGPDGTFPGEYGPCVDVKWAAGRCFQYVDELLPQPQPPKGPVPR